VPSFRLARIGIKHFIHAVGDVRALGVLAVSQEHQYGVTQPRRVVYKRSGIKAFITVRTMAFTRFSQPPPTV
jgi:hypothetical protein